MFQSGRVPNGVNAACLFLFVEQPSEAPDANSEETSGLEAAWLYPSVMSVSHNPVRQTHFYDKKKPKEVSVPK